MAIGLELGAISDAVNSAIILPGDVIVLIIERGGDIVVPDRETALRANDIVTLVGSGDDVDEAARFLARNGP